jgi:putative transposase
LKTIYYTYKFRLQLTNEQQHRLSQHFGAIRWTYNHFLNQRKEYYQENKKSINYNKQSALLTQLKKQKDTSWLKDINSQSLQYSLSCLEIAYNNFFRGNTRFPRFKSRKGKNSFTVPQFINIKKNILSIPKFRDGLKMIVARPINGTVKQCTLSKTSTGKYFVSILTEKQYTPVQKTNKSVGIDLGLKDFLVTSDGLKAKNPRNTKKYQRSLTLNQKHLSRKIKGSNRYERQRLKVTRIHEKISNSRNDNLHKLSHWLITNYDIICVEDLNVKGMVKNYKLSKHISDASWGHFIELLSYKAEWNDKQVVKINRFFPSSKTCHNCGWINNSLTLNDRIWTCSKCNSLIDRDLNAAKNILKEGLKTISVGTTDYGRGGEIRLDLSSTTRETSKKKSQFDLETTTSLA